MPDPYEDRLQKIQEFHEGLLTYQSEGKVEGVPDDFEIFNKAFNHPDYRKDLHDYLLMKQSEGSVQDVPGNYRQFSGFFDPLPETEPIDPDQVFGVPGIDRPFDVDDPRSEKSIAKREYMGMRHPESETDLVVDTPQETASMQSLINNITAGDINALENLNDVETARLAESIGVEVDRFEKEIEKFKSPFDLVDDRTHMKTISHVEEYERYEELRRAQGILERNLRNPDDWHYLEKLANNVRDRFIGASIGVASNFVAMREMFLSDPDAQKAAQQTRKRLEQSINSYYETTDAVHFTDIGSKDGYVPDMVRWVAGTQAELIPIVGSIMAGGALAVGGATYAGLGGAGVLASSYMGSFLVGYGMYAGDMFGTLTNEDVERDTAKKTALIYGIPASAVSIVVPATAGSYLMGLFGKTYMKRHMKDILVKAGITAVTEGTAESIAESFVIVGEEQAMGIKYSWPEKIDRVINAGAAGALMGFSLGFTAEGGRPRTTVDESMGEFLDHSGAITGQNPELMSIKERVEFEYNPDAPPAEQKSQLSSELTRLENQRKQAEMNLETLETDQGRAEAESLINDYSLAIDAINDQINRIDSGVVTDLMTNLSNRPVLQEFLLESLINLEEQGISLTPEQQQFKLYLQDDRGPTSNKAMREMNRTTDTIAVEVQKRTDQHNKQRLDKLMQLSRDGQTSFEEQVEIAAIMFNKPKVHQAWLNGDETVQGETEDTGIQDGEGQTGGETTAPTGRRPDIQFVDENQNRQSLGELIEAADNPQDVLDQLPFMEELHQEIKTAETVDQAHELMSQRGYEFSRTDATLNRYLSEVIEGTEQQNLAEWMIGLEPSQTTQQVQIPEEEQVQYQDPETGEWTSAFEMTPEDIQLLSDTVESIVDDGHRSGDSTQEIFESLEAAGIVTSPNNQPFRNWIENYNEPESLVSFQDFINSRLSGIETPTTFVPGDFTPPVTDIISERFTDAESAPEHIRPVFSHLQRLLPDDAHEAWFRRGHAGQGIRFSAQNTAGETSLVASLTETDTDVTLHHLFATGSGAMMAKSIIDYTMSRGKEFRSDTMVNKKLVDATRILQRKGYEIEYNENVRSYDTENNPVSNIHGLTYPEGTVHTFVSSQNEAPVFRILSAPEIVTTQQRARYIAEKIFRGETLTTAEEQFSANNFDLMNQEYAKVEADLPPDSEFMVEANEVVADNLTQEGTLGEVEGTVVDYGQYQGILTRDSEGNFVVETDDGTLIEVADSRKDPDVPIVNVGVSRALSSLRSFRRSTGNTFILETTDPATGEISSESYNYTQTNENDAGDVVSITMETPDGESRVFRNPQLIEQVMFDLLSDQTDGQSELIDNLPPPTQEEIQPEADADVVTPLRHPMRLDNNDPRLDAVFDRFENQQTLTQQEQQEALEWINERLEDVLQRNPSNIDELLHQLTQFESEVIENDTTTRPQPSDELPPVPPAEDEVSPDAPTTEDQTTTQIDLEGEARPTATEKLETRPEYHLTQNEYLDSISDQLDSIRETNPDAAKRAERRLVEQHKQYVADAIQDGHAIPEAVLIDYPDLARNMLPDGKSTAPVENIPSRPAREMTREILTQHLSESVEAGTLTQAQAEALANLVDVRAHLWAKQNRRPEGDYYKIRFDQANGRDTGTIVEEVVDSYNGAYNTIREAYENGMASRNRSAQGKQRVPIEGTNRVMQYQSLRALESRDVQSVEDIGIGEYVAEVRTYRPSSLHRLHSQSLQLKSHADVAYLFTELENSANENAYFVMVDADNNPTVIHHSTGNQKKTLVDLSALKSYIKDFKPKRVYMVHNHPNGTIKPSEGDVTAMRRIRRAMPEGVDAYGIIINRDSGFFATFNETSRYVTRDGMVSSLTGEGQPAQELQLASVSERQNQIRQETAIPVNVLSYDRLSLLSNPMSTESIRSPADVARLIGLKQFSLGNKDTAIFVNPNKQIVGVIHLNNEVLTETGQVNPKSVGELGLLSSRFNAADFFIASNRQYNESVHENVVGRMTDALHEQGIMESVVVDYIMVDTPADGRSIRFGDSIARDIDLLSIRGQQTQRTEGAFVNVESDDAQFYANEEEAIYNIFSEPKDLQGYVKDFSRIFLKDLRGNDLAIIEKWSGAEEGNWNQQAYEKLEQGFTEYLAEGKSPSQALGRVFGQFKEWLQNIYDYLTAQDSLVLTDEVRGVFDSLFEATIEELRNPVLPEAQRGWEIDIAWNPDGSETHQGHFGIIELSDLQASHHPDGHTNSRHVISRGQPRDRSSARAKQTQEQTAQNLNPAYIAGNHSTAFFFSPVINSRGEVIQGNGRSISLKIAASQYPGRFNDYQSHILNNAEEFGFDRSYVEGFRQPVIVRMLDVSDTEAVRLGNIQQKAELEMSRAEQALASIRQMSTEQKQHIGRLISDSQAETFRAMLDGIGIDIIDIVLPDRGDFIDSNGNITIDGKNFIEDVFRAMVFDSEVNTEAISIFKRLPHPMRAGLEKSYGTILEFSNTAADIRPSLQKAIEIVHRVNQNPDWENVDDMFSSAGMFENYAELYTAAERTLATALFDTQNPNSPLMKDLGTTGTQTGIQRLFRRYKDHIYGREDLFDPIPGLGIERSTEAFQKTFDQRNESTRYPDRPAGPESAVESPPTDFDPDSQPERVIPDQVNEEVVNNQTNRKEQLLFAGVLPKIINAIRGKGPKQKSLTSRQDITNHVIQNLGVSVGIGRSRQLMNALGFYRWKPMGSAIRMRVANNISTLAHETGHYLHDILFDMHTPGRFDGELIRLGERTSREDYSRHQRIMEGQAEFFRILVHNTELAQRSAPTYYKAFQEKLNDNPVIKRGVNDLIQLIEGYTSQSPADQFRSQIARDRQDHTATGPQNETLAQYTERSLFNAITPFRIARQDLLTADNQIDTEAFSTDAYYLSQLSAGVPGQMMTWIRDGIRNPDGEMVHGSFEAIFQNNDITKKHQIEQFEDYLLARRVLELYEQSDLGLRELANRSPEGGALGFTSEQARAIISEVKEAGLSDSYQTASQQLYDWVDATLEWTVDRGYMSRTELEAMKRLNRNYVPMHRVMDHIRNTRDGRKSTMIDQPSLWKRIRGSGRPVLPPIQTLLRNTQRMMYMVERNYAAIQLFEDLNKSQRGGLWADKVSRPVKPVKGELSEIKKALEEAGLTKEILDAMDLDTAFELWRPMEHNSAKREVTFRRDGETHIWQIHNNALYEALTSYSHPTTGTFGRLLQLSKRIFRTGVVISLDFIAGVTQSDQLAAHLNSTYGYSVVHLNPFKKDFGSSDFFKGMASILTNSEEYQLWLHSKAGISGIVDVQSDQVGRALVRLGDNRAERIIKNIIFPARWLQGMESFSAVFENATRVGEFRRGLEVEGRSEEGLARAAVGSRNLTDYALLGRSNFVRMIARNKAFFSAGLQGPYASVQAIRRSPVGFMSRGVLTMTLLSLALDRAMEDNEDYQEREQERQLYWLIPRGNPRTTTEFIRIRKPWQFGAFFGTVIPNALQQAAGYEDFNLLEYLIPNKDDAFTILASMVPNAILPLTEVAFGDQGYNFFYQGPIDPYFDKDIEPYLRYDHRTNELEKKLGRMVNASPRKIRHLIRGYSGMVGVNVSDLSSEFLLSQLQITGEPAAPETDIVSKIPGARVFIPADLTAGRSKSVREFYKLLDESRVAKNSVSKEDLRRQTQYYIDNMDLINARPKLEKYNNRLSDYRDRAASIYIHPTMTPQQKRQALYDINQRMIMQARQALEAVGYESQPRISRPEIPQR